MMEESVGKPNRTGDQIILSLFHGMWQNRCLGVVVGLNIPEILCNAEQPSISIDDLAKQAGCASSEQLYPVMRVLAQWGIGTELPSKQFTNNRTMELLRKDRGPSLGSMVAYFNSDENWAAMLALPEAVKTGQPAFKLEHGMTHCDYMNSTQSYAPAKMRPGCSKYAIGSRERRNEYTEIYNHAMTQFGNLQLYDSSVGSRSIYNVFPWPSCSRLMDIGGSTGSFLASILKQPGCEHIQGIVVDLHAVIEDAKSKFHELGVDKDRVSLLAHDSFQPFPELPEIDTIVSKNLFEMFTMQQCCTVLQNCRHLFPDKGGRFLVITPCLPNTGEVPLTDGVQLEMVNIHVCSTGTGYKSKNQWIELFEAVAKRTGYKLKQVYDLNSGSFIFELIYLS